MYKVRPARESDADALAILAEGTFRDAFSADNVPEDMNMHCAKRFGRDIQAREIMSPTMRTFVADLDGVLIGFGQLCRTPAPAAVTARSTLEIHRLYVDRRWQGKGIAQELMRTMLDSAAGESVGCVWLGVWEKNPRAIAFYEKSGFEVVGEHVFTLGSDPQRDLIMVTSLGREKAVS